MSKGRFGWKRLDEKDRSLSVDCATRAMRWGEGSCWGGSMQKRSDCMSFRLGSRGMSEHSPRS